VLKKTVPDGAPGGGCCAGRVEVRTVPSAPKVLSVTNGVPWAGVTVTRQEPTKPFPSAGWVAP
jgi:hypothetical protein